METQAYIAEELARRGVEHLFCFPSTPMIKAATEAGIRPIICRQERVGANMADGYSRVTNGEEIGVFASQYGPGAENAFPGIATAYADSSPVLYLARGYDRDRAGVSPYFSVEESFAPITKWVEYLSEPGQAPDAMRRAFSQLRRGRPRPVALEVPDDVLSAEAPESTGGAAPVEPVRSSGDPDDVAAAVEALLAAERPVIHAGQGVLYAGATRELVEVAELLGVPVMTTLEGKSAFPEDHELALGTGARTNSGPVRALLPEGDLVFGIGCSFTEHGMSVTIPEGPTMVHATNDPADVGKMYDVDHAVVGDAKLVLEQVRAEAIRQRGSEASRETDAAERVAAAREAWLAEWRPHLTSDETPLSPFRVIHEFMETIDPAEAIVTHDSGGPRDQLSPFYVATAPRSYLGWGKSHSLGTGLGLALGAKLARPEKLCVNFMGDAAFGMVGLDFETAVRHEIPIVTVVLANGAMAGYEDRLGDERFLGGDYVEIARALGGHAERIVEPDEIAGAFRRAKDHTETEREPVLLEFATREETGQKRLMGL